MVTAVSDGSNSYMTVYILYDLTKFTKTSEEIRTGEDRWLYLLKHAGAAENLPDFNDNVIAKAIKRLLVNDAPEKLLKDQAVDMVLTEEQLDFLASLKVRARKEGLEEGRNDERIATALDMLANNEPVEKIVKYSHLPEEKILELRDSRALAAAK